MSSEVAAAAGVNLYYARFLVGVGQVCAWEGYTLLLTPPLQDSVLKAIPYAARARRCAATAGPRPGGLAGITEALAGAGLALRDVRLTECR